MLINLKEVPLPKYDHLTKDELVALLYKRDSARKLGLVWERDEIDHEVALNDDFVCLNLDTSLSVGRAPFDNMLIEGDNFDALRYLHIAYKGRVKCIYIDPPYNTGNKDFIFNDRFLDKDDSYRHSKWLEFMYRRLTLAKDLLADDGVIFISIDDIESAHLRLLMDQIMPGMRVGTFVWRRRSGANDEKEWFLSADHEYVLCYANPGFSFAGLKKDWSKAINDNDPRGPWIDGPLNQGKDIRQRPDGFYPVHDSTSNVWYPCDPDSVWRFATRERVKGKKLRTKTMETLVEEKCISWPKDQKYISYASLDELWTAIKEGTAPHNFRLYERLDDFGVTPTSNVAAQRIWNNIPPIEFWIGKTIGYGKPRYKRFTEDIKKKSKPVSTWILPSSTTKTDRELVTDANVEVLESGFTSEGTTLLAQMVKNKDFPYPKPVSLIKSLISQVTNGEEGHIVMDFFAGSGTTGHAVMALNAKDNGNRTFVLVSSSEATTQNPKRNVCRDITAKRLRSAIEGYSYRTAKGVTMVEGMSAEFAYLTASRVPRETVAIDIRHEQIWLALLQIHANVVSPFQGDQSLQILNSDETSYDIIYIAELDDTSVDALQMRLDHSLKPCIIYSWQPGLLLQRFRQDYISVKKIPEYLIERFGGVGL